MGYRVQQLSGRSAWYVLIDKPSWARSGRGSNTIKRKAGETKKEALQKALAIAGEVIKELESKRKPEEPTAPPESGSWMEWVEQRQLGDHTIAASTVVNWRVKLKGLAEWYGNDQLAGMTKTDAYKYKLYLMNDRKLGHQSIRNYIAGLSGFWNWGIDSGNIEGINIWKGQKKGLQAAKKRAPLDRSKLRNAELLAYEYGDIRFFFGRYQGLRKEDYCGLRWSDIDMKNGVIHLCRYVYKDQHRNLKLKEHGERIIPIHSKLLKLIDELLPEARTRNDEVPIWGDDYKPALQAWGCRWAERFSDRYGFGSHCLRSYVVTQMLRAGITSYFLKAITGHTDGDTAKVVEGYFDPVIDEVREYLEKLN